MMLCAVTNAYGWKGDDRGIHSYVDGFEYRCASWWIESVQ